MKVVVCVEKVIVVLCEFVIGGIVVGIGINCYFEFVGKVCCILIEKIGVFFYEVYNYFEV